MREKSFELYLEKVNDLQERSVSFVTVTLVDAVGSTPQDVGARAIVSLQGLEFGTVGGGKVEKYSMDLAQKFLFERVNVRQLQKINLQKDLGMSCGGEVSLFFETHLVDSQWNIVVFGAGHVAQELIPLLLKLDCRVTCVDSRPEWLAKIKESPRLSVVHLDHPSDYVSQIPDGSFIAVMTMGHGSDLPILEKILSSRSFPYVGAIGSEIKAKRLRTDLLGKGILPDKVESLICPIGEDFGTNSPVEIAFSVIAQMLKVRS